MALYYNDARLHKQKNQNSHDSVYKKQQTFRIGTAKMPACVTVQTEEREQELSATFKEHGWHYTITIDPEIQEDTKDLELLLSMPKTQASGCATGRNDLCPCGSGKKFKKCCGK